MSFELAEKLKKAGFPYKAKTVLNEYGLKDLSPIFSPTLTELIEACGKRFYSLIKVNDEPTFEACDGNFDNSTFRFGSTPEEATAKLWLALNKKE